MKGTRAAARAQAPARKRAYDRARREAMTADRLHRQRVYNRAYYHDQRRAPVAEPPEPPSAIVHQLIRTFPPPLPGTIALSFYPYRGRAR